MQALEYLKQSMKDDREPDAQKCHMGCKTYI